LYNDAVKIRYATAAPLIRLRRCPQNWVLSGRFEVFSNIALSQGCPIPRHVQKVLSKLRMHTSHTRLIKRSKQKSTSDLSAAYEECGKLFTGMNCIISRMYNIFTDELCCVRVMCFLFVYLCYTVSQFHCRP